MVDDNNDDGRGSQQIQKSVIKKERERDCLSKLENCILLLTYLHNTRHSVTKHYSIITFIRKF